MVDPFALLGLPRAFDIDQRAMEAAYLKRSAALHPDRFSNPIEQAEAQRRTAELNDARAMLLDDEQRANALLALLGGRAKEQDKSLPDGFLIAMMEVRQEMEAALAAHDEAEQRRLEQWALERRKRHIETVRTEFASLGATPDMQLAAIRRELNAWRYIERMLEQLHAP